MAKQVTAQVQEKGFNILAFFFPVAYYGGKGSFKQSLTVAFFGALPLIFLGVPFYAGFKANRDLKSSDFSWGKAILVSCIHLGMLGITLSLASKYKIK